MWYIIALHTGFKQYSSLREPKYHIKVNILRLRRHKQQLRLPRYCVKISTLSVPKAGSRYSKVTCTLYTRFPTVTTGVGVVTPRNFSPCSGI